MEYVIIIQAGDSGRIDNYMIKIKDVHQLQVEEIAHRWEEV